MGIPRLVTHLVPFATKVRYTAEDTKSPTPVVIDGPGLAYYAASLALHKFGRIPSYGEIGDAALLFLQDLQAHGLNVYVGNLYCPVLGFLRVSSVQPS
jgi:hypothetical protein